VAGVTHERAGSSPEAPVVLFVCAGNTCRSPLAEALARQWAGERGLRAGFESAGVSAAEDAPASAEAIAVGREAGLDLEAHRARLLTRPMVLAARLVLVMGRLQAEFIAVLAPEARARVHGLRAYATRGAATEDVADPFGGDRARYRRTLEEMRPLVERALQRFDQEARIHPV
jgi:protein-tyrosine-phosphatase